MNDSNNSEQTDLDLSVDTDTISTPEIDAVESESSPEVDTQVETEEGVEESTDINDLVYDIDGEEVSVSTVLDWKKGHLMQSDYTKKSQANAEAKKALEADQAKTVALNSQLESTITNFEQSLKTEASKIDWEDLRENNTPEYLRQKELIGLKAKQLQKAKADMKAKQDAEYTSYITEQQGHLLKSQPTWADTKQREADIALIDTYVSEAGFNETEIKELVNHKIMNAILDAARYKELVNKSETTKKAVQKAPNVVKATKKKTTQTNTGEVDWYAKPAKSG